MLRISRFREKDVQLVMFYVRISLSQIKIASFLAMTILTSSLISLLPGLSGTIAGV